MTKKCLLLCFAMQCIQGMKTNSLQKTSVNSWDILHYKTKINLIQEKLFNNISNKVNLIIIGKNLQVKLLKRNRSQCFLMTHYSSLYHIGTTLIPCNNGEISSLEIVEPYIEQRRWSDQKNHFIYRTAERSWYDKEAIQHGLQDLAMCYDTVLTKGTKKTIDLNAKTIALPTLSTKLGLSLDKATPIAIKQVMQFIEKNPKAYDVIYLVVEDITEFNLYKLLLLQHSGILHNICLFYWIHKDHDILSQLPKEVRDYIAQLV